MDFQSKLDVRQLRKSILDDVKKVKGAVSADDSKRFTKEVLYCHNIIALTIAYLDYYYCLSF